TRYRIGQEEPGEPEGQPPEHPQPNGPEVLPASSPAAGAVPGEEDGVLQAARPSPVTPGASLASGEPVPRQLPTAVAHFAGRARELEELDEQLAELDRGRAGTVVISAIGGTAGVGKTTLALHWAHRVAPRFPDGQLYANLRGFDTSGKPADPAD